MKISLRIVAASSAIAVLAACGAKGPLFMPDNPPKDQSIIAPSGAGAAANGLGHVTPPPPVATRSVQAPAAASVTVPASATVAPPAGTRSAP